MEYIVLAYIIQIPLALYAMFKIPRRGELPTFYENARKNIVLWGFLPCSFFSVFIQLIGLGVYMAKVKTVESRAQSAQVKLGGAPPSSPGANPFGAKGAPAPPSAESGSNPFAGGGGGARPTQPEENPFDSDGDESTPPSSDNPFA